jgi:glyoxylase-like metal-dependent hydrolase (beta-lactamase superfamily II)
VVVRDGNVQIERLSLGLYNTNTYIISDMVTGDSVLVDAPADAGLICEKLNGTTPRAILLTHCHFDHIGALKEVKSCLGVPLAAHEADAGRLPEWPDRLLSHGECLPCGTVEIVVLHTPGHTLGSLCFLVGRYLISGDTLFPGGPGLTATPEAFSRIVESITRRLFVLPDDIVVFPGHGGDTVLGKEKEAFKVFGSRSHSPELCRSVRWLKS